LLVSTSPCGNSIAIRRPPQRQNANGLLAADAAAPLHSDDTVREAVRALLRQGGFKPTGRSKPASEYLLKAVRENLLSSINVAVDACNIVSLHSGLPISVVDLDRTREPGERARDEHGHDDCARHVDPGISGRALALADGSNLISQRCAPREEGEYGQSGERD